MQITRVIYHFQCHVSIIQNIFYFSRIRRDSFSRLYQSVLDKEVSLSRTKQIFLTQVPSMCFSKKGCLFHLIQSPIISPWMNVFCCHLRICPFQLHFCTSEITSIVRINWTHISASENMFSDWMSLCLGWSQLRCVMLVDILNFSSVYMALKAIENWKSGS